MTPILSDEEIRAIVRDIPARPYRDADGEPTSVRIARAVESAVLAKLAARMGEPAAWQFRMRPTWDASHPWTNWADIAAAGADYYIKTPVVGDWEYEVRPLVALQQPQQYTIDHAAATAAIATGLQRLNDEKHERTPRSGTTFGAMNESNPKKTNGTK